MDLKRLTDYQLFEIIQNQKLDSQLRALANDEFNLGRLSNEQIAEIIRRHDSLFRPDHKDPLSIKFKLLALVVPFFWVVHVLVSSRFLAVGAKRKWNEYWLFFCIGLLIWTIIVILIGKFYVN